MCIMMVAPAWVVQVNFGVLIAVNTGPKIYRKKRQKKVMWITCAGTLNIGYSRPMTSTARSIAVGVCRNTSRMGLLAVSATGSLHELVTRPRFAPCSVWSEATATSCPVTQKSKGYQCRVRKEGSSSYEGHEGENKNERHTPQSRARMLTRTLWLFVIQGGGHFWPVGVEQPRHRSFAVPLSR